MDYSHFNSVFAKLRRVRRTPKGWSACCPAHEDKHASLTLNIGDNGNLLIKCHAGHGCSFAAIAAAMGVSEKDFAPPEFHVPQELDTAYSYVDEQGKLLYQVVRFRQKRFAQRRPLAVDGDGRVSQWEWGLGDTRRVLYRLNKLAREAKKRKVIVVEGEKDVSSLEKIGLLATCNSGGAGKWPDEESEVLRGAHIVVIGDNDGPGKAHALDIAGKLLPLVSSLKLIEALPGVPEKEDVSWWLQNGGTREKLIDLIESTPVWMPDVAHKSEECSQDKQAIYKPDTVTGNQGASDGASDVEAIMRQAELLPPKDLVWLVRSLLVCVERVVP